MQLNPIILNFLKSLSQNNNREWFTVHKDEYLKAKTAQEDFTAILIMELSKFDNGLRTLSPKDCIFRIYKDTRFSKDKTPYKTNMGCYLVNGGKNSPYAGYYLHIEPGNCFLGGGIYMPEPPVLKGIRTEIYNYIEEFHEIVDHEDFKSTFGQIEGDRLKLAPKGFPADFKDINFLKYKDYTMMHRFEDRLCHSGDFLQFCAHIFEKMTPLNAFLNRAILENT